MLYDLVSCPITYDLCSRYQPKLSNNLSIDEAWVDGFTRLYAFIYQSKLCVVHCCCFCLEDFGGGSKL